MLRWAILFLVIALVSAALGFFALEDTAAWAAKICFIVFLVVFVFSLLFGRRSTADLV